MKFKFTKITAAVAFVLVTTTGAIGSDSKRVGAYDFGYLTSGHQKAAPVQVFDNGRATYFQFRAGEAIPAIFAKVAGVTTLLVPEHEGPYIKVPSVHGEFTLQLGRSQAMVVHGDGVRLDAPAISTVSPSGLKAPYMGGQVAPGTRLVASLASQAPVIVDDAEDRNSYATPVKGDRVQWGTGEASTQSHAVWFGKGRSILGPQGKALLVKLAKTSPPGTTFTLVGRDDDSLKEGIEQARAEAMRKQMILGGAPASAIVMKNAVAGKVENGLWESNVLVDTPAPRRAAYTASAEAAQGRGAVSSNLESLVRQGVLSLAQANALLASKGISAPQSVNGPAVDVPPGGYNMLASDRTVHGTVSRWANALGYTVVWEVPPELDAQVSGDAAIKASSMKEALERLLSGLRKAGYHIDATVYSNRVIRFLPAGTPTTTKEPEARPAPTNSIPTQKVEQAAATNGNRYEAASSSWVVSAEDKSIEQLLNRWGRDSNWSVVWNAKDTVPITGNAVIDKPSFLSAADQVIAQAGSAGYRVRAVAYANNTLVVSSY